MTLKNNQKKSEEFICREINVFTKNNEKITGKY